MSDKKDDLAKLRKSAESVAPELRAETIGFRVSTVLRLIDRVEAAEKNEAEAEEACLEAQNERDELRERLDGYEPPLKPRKCV